MIFCAGNHDICTKTVDENHRTQCYAYENGVEYIRTNENLQNSFKRYESFNIDFPFNPDLIKITSRNDYIYETKHVRFIVLNSSWLSQFNFDEHEHLREKLIALNDETFEEAIRDNFNGAFCLPKSETLAKELAFKHTFNYNENTRQQVDAEILNYLNDDSGKLNLLIQHHPRECLHYLDHHEINDMQSSGKYRAIEQYADALLCGHIHPRGYISPLKGLGGALQFIGAPCHLEPKENAILNGDDIKKIETVTDRPRFYYYTFQTNGKGFDYEAFSYSLRKDGNFENRLVDTSPNNLLHEIDEQQNSDCFGISKECTIEELRDLFEKAYIKLMKSFFEQKKISISIKPIIIKFDRTYYQVTSQLQEIIVNENVYIYLDIIGIHDLYKIHYATSKIEKLSNKEKLREEATIPLHIAEDDILYYPIIVDTLAGASSIDNLSRIKNIDSLLGKISIDGTSLNLFLTKHYGSSFIENSILEKIKNIILLQKEALHALINATFVFDMAHTQALKTKNLSAQLILK